MHKQEPKERLKKKLNFINRKLANLQIPKSLSSSSKLLSSSTMANNGVGQREKKKGKREQKLSRSKLEIRMNGDPRKSFRAFLLYPANRAALNDSEI